MSLRARIADVDEATYGTIRRAYRDLMGTMPHDPTLFEVERLAVATRRPLAKDE